MKQIECIVPILNVADISVSTTYYVQSLGFKVDWEHREDGYVISGVSRDGHAIYLCQGAQGIPGTWVWIGVEDVDQLFAEYQAKGAMIVMRPTNHSWAREMHLSDPDGHVLRFASDPTDD